MSSAHPPPTSRLPDSDMQAAPSVLLRAAQRARELAARTGTHLVYTENGKLVKKQAILATGETRETTDTVPDT
jgi:hypothetical protein